MKILYLILTILSLTILNWTWVQNINGNKVYLYEIYLLKQLQNDMESHIILLSIWIILLITVGLFYLCNDFRYYDLIIGYIIYKCIPFISDPINIP